MAIDLEHKSGVFENRSGFVFAPLVVLLMLLGFGYHDAPDNVFHLDDYPNIVDAASIHVDDLTLGALIEAARGAHLPGRPLANMTLAIDWWRGGGEPRPFQWTNMVAHGAGAAVVFWLLSLVLRRRDLGPGTAAVAAFFGAAVWACHPIQVQAVTYIVQRMASLSALFTVLSVVLYLVARRCGGRRRLGLLSLAAASFLLAVACKETGFIAPFLVLLAEYGVVRHGRPLVRRWFDCVLIALPAVLFAYLIIDIASGLGPVAREILPAFEKRDFTLEQRLLTQPRVIAFHFSQVLWPLPGRFSLEHDFVLSRGMMTPPSTAIALLGLLVWCAIGVRALFSQHWRVAGFFLLWVPTALAIESSFIPLEMVFEHRMYLPTVGLAGLAALGIAWLIQQSGVLRILSTVVVVVVPMALTMSTSLRVLDWRTELILAHKSVEHAPNSARAWYRLGALYVREADLVTAASHFQRAVALAPNHPPALNNLGNSYFMLGQRARAIALWKRALAADPKNPSPAYNLGLMAEQAGDMEGALGYYRQYLAVSDKVPPAILQRIRRVERLVAPVERD